jgi:hypothetical protein
VPNSTYSKIATGVSKQEINALLFAFLKLMDIKRPGISISVIGILSNKAPIRVDGTR